MRAPATLLGIVVFASIASVAEAKEWFVAPGGSGNGDAATPFGKIQQGIDAAQPGDFVTVAAGSYAEALKTVRDGNAASPITVRAASGAKVDVTLGATLLRVDHAYFVLDGFVLDGQYASFDLVDVNDGATGLLITNTEIRRATKDCVDMAGPADVTLDRCLIHHCLNAAGGQTDAHGVTGGPVKNLTIRDTEIHTCSGDSIQFDPGRELPGWSDILVEGCKLWTGPLASAENGFAVGAVPGENAIDTKTNPAAPRAKLTVVNTSAWGFRGGFISNMAAFNLKENIDAVFDRVTVFDSEIAFRTRGPGSNGGAWVRIQNAVVYDVDKAVRYEDDIEKLAVLNATFGGDVLAAFQAASSGATKPDVRNLLVLGGSLPAQATAASNLATTAAAFVDASKHDYHLVAGSLALDKGETIAEVALDRDGTSRPQAAAYDVGAYEHCTGASCGGGAGSGGAGSGGASSGGASSGGASSGGAGVGGVGGASSGGASGSGASGGSGDSDDDGGCGCRTSPTRSTPLELALGLGALAAWRVRRRQTRVER
ncbi:MAG: hypothetical protein AMXMBFR56_22460 [Polyangiaceae bacterium]